MTLESGHFWPFFAFECPISVPVSEYPSRMSQADRGDVLFFALAMHGGGIHTPHDTPNRDGSPVASKDVQQSPAGIKKARLIASLWTSIDLIGLSDGRVTIESVTYLIDY